MSTKSDGVAKTQHLTDKRKLDTLSNLVIMEQMNKYM